MRGSRRPNSGHISQPRRVHHRETMRQQLSKGWAGGCHVCGTSVRAGIPARIHIGKVRHSLGGQRSVGAAWTRHSPLLLATTATPRAPPRPRAHVALLLQALDPHVVASASAA